MKYAHYLLYHIYCSFFLNGNNVSTNEDLSLESL